MKKIFQQGRTALGVGLLILSASGCVPLVLGAAAGVGGYAWIQGELTNDLNVSAEKLHRAASRACRDLKLAVYKDVGDRLNARINAKFVDGADVKIAIEAKTEQVANIKIRVGLLGDKEKSEIILRAIQKRL